ncbi:MAG: PilZ domain-containing protein [Phycisphaerales bacterium]
MSRSRSDSDRAIQQVINCPYPGPERRRSVRFKLGELKCNLGRVLDLSSGGVRLLHWRRLKGRHEITLYDRDGGVRVEAEIRWTRRLGLFKHEMGLQFVNVPPDIAAKLKRLFSKNRI